VILGDAALDVLQGRVRPGVDEEFGVVVVVVVDGPHDSGAAIDVLEAEKGLPRAVRVREEQERESEGEHGAAQVVGEAWWVR